jgi:uncharacterized protein involved in outer membrane biogenesis
MFVRFLPEGGAGAKVPLRNGQVMRWLFKWVWRLVFLALALVILLFVFKDSILRRVVEHRFRAQTGMDVQIGGLSSGVLSPVVTLRNLRLYNTAEFGGTPFMIVPELHLEFDPAALARRELHITLMRFDLAELDVVKNEAGQTNLVSILNKVRTRTSTKSGLQELLQDFKFTGIDVLNLTVGKARYIDLKQAGNNREIRVDLQNQIFRNVKSDADVYGILFMIWLRSGGSFSLGPADAPRVTAAGP